MAPKKRKTLTRHNSTRKQARKALQSAACSSIHREKRLRISRERAQKREPRGARACRFEIGEKLGHRDIGLKFSELSSKLETDTAPDLCATFAPKSETPETLADGELLETDTAPDLVRFIHSSPEVRDA